jgi:hypothetical protein
MILRKSSRVKENLVEPGAVIRFVRGRPYRLGQYSYAWDFEPGVKSIKVCGVCPHNFPYRISSFNAIEFSSL